MPPADTSFRVARIFQDGMVAQRASALPVWGIAPPGTEVTVRLDDEEHSVQTGASGRWRIKMEPRSAGGPHTLTISAGEAVVTISDLIYGDVWVASGQSNMEWIVANSNNAAAEIAAANDPAIRQFKVPLTWAYQPQEELAGGAWSAATPDEVGHFSAVAYFFARELRRNVPVPIGIINTSWGGSRIEPWMDPESLDMTEAELEELLRAEQSGVDSLKARLARRFGEVPTTDAGLVDGDAIWARPDLDETGWDVMPIPGQWESAGLESLDGVVWFRKHVTLTAGEAASRSTLRLAAIDDSDKTWVNGTRVGGLEGAWNVLRQYEVPQGILRAGVNVITVRVVDTGGAGGVHGADEDVRLDTGTTVHPLAGEWKYRIGKAEFASGSRKNQVPTLLYNQMVHPIINFPVTGFLWYQGESNASFDDAPLYADQFKAMIQRWRELWQAPEAPFLFVQLANFMAPSAEPTESSWAILRESQSAALALENVGEAVIIDIGQADDIHPRNKQDVGLRLSLAARAFAYGQPVVHSGPVYVRHELRGSEVLVRFSSARGLQARGGPVGGFALAGAEGAFRWAEGRIEGSTVLLSAPGVAEPLYVRYAWADNPDGANLYNGAGLPASPFRTGR
ncbi:MAG: sialate O-acetylesterase [Rhodothermales bacterium]|jgi:sialate O-acetylesterase